MFKLESDIPLPPSYVKVTRREPPELAQVLRRMEVGQSFLLPLQVSRNLVHTLTYRYCPERAFETRKVGNGQVRVWRTK